MDSNVLTVTGQVNKTGMAKAVSVLMNHPDWVLTHTYGISPMGSDLWDLTGGRMHAPFDGLHTFTFPDTKHKDRAGLCLLTLASIGQTPALPLMRHAAENNKEGDDDENISIVFQQTQFKKQHHYPGGGW